jgi:hypothetical protein
MNFNIKSMKYAVAIFTVFAISGLLYTSSITQYGFAQNNSSSNSSSSSGGSASQGSSGNASSGGQQNDIGSIKELQNATGSNQNMLGNNTSISSSSLGKLGNESSMDKPNMTKQTGSQNQSSSSGAGQSQNQSSSSGAGQSQNQSSSSGAGQQSSGGAGQNQSKSSNPLDMLTKLFSGGK